MAREGGVELDDDANLGRPENWKKHVQDQMRRLGSWSGTVRDYSGVQRGEPLAGTLGEPQPVGESMEQQIHRIDNLLAEQQVDVRLYKMNMLAKVSEDRAKNIKALTDQLRAITSVTTISNQGAKDVLYGEEILFTLKFALVGQQSRTEFIEGLVPIVNAIQGCQLARVWPAEEITSGRTQKINEAGFGSFAGLGGYAPEPRTPPMPTPAFTLGAVLDDWMSGGVMDYDVAVDTTDMRYHVMVTVEELLPYISREFRAPKDAYDGMYHNFIKTGATAPVFVAVGKNGRVRITGNEDLVWYAKRSGLQELPVFFSYQRQV
jgi:hypothetical protein